MGVGCVRTRDRRVRKESSIERAPSFSTTIHPSNDDDDDDDRDGRDIDLDLDLDGKPLPLRSIGVATALQLASCMKNPPIFPAMYASHLVPFLWLPLQYLSRHL